MPGPQAPHHMATVPRQQAILPVPSTWRTPATLCSTLALLSLGHWAFMILLCNCSAPSHLSPAAGHDPESSRTTGTAQLWGDGASPGASAPAACMREHIAEFSDAPTSTSGVRPLHISGAHVVFQVYSSCPATSLHPSWAEIPK